MISKATMVLFKKVIISCYYMGLSGHTWGKEGNLLVRPDSSGWSKKIYKYQFLFSISFFSYLLICFVRMLLLNPEELQVAEKMLAVYGICMGILTILPQASYLLQEEECIEYINKFLTFNHQMIRRYGVDVNESDGLDKIMKGGIGLAISEVLLTPPTIMVLMQYFPEFGNNLILPNIGDGLMIGLLISVALIPAWGCLIRLGFLAWMHCMSIKKCLDRMRTSVSGEARTSQTSRVEYRSLQLLNKFGPAIISKWASVAVASALLFTVSAIFVIVRFNTELDPFIQIMFISEAFGMIQGGRNFLFEACNMSIASEQYLADSFSYFVVNTKLQKYHNCFLKSCPRFNIKLPYMFETFEKSTGLEVLQTFVIDWAIDLLLTYTEHRSLD